MSAWRLLPNKASRSPPRWSWPIVGAATRSSYATCSGLQSKWVRPEWRFLKQLVQEKQGDTSAKYLCASEGSRQEPQATKHFGDTLLPWLYPNSLILQIFPFRKCHSGQACNQRIFRTT